MIYLLWLIVVYVGMLKMFEMPGQGVVNGDFGDGCLIIQASNLGHLFCPFALAQQLMRSYPLPFLDTLSPRGY